MTVEDDMPSVAEEDRNAIGEIERHKTLSRTNNLAKEHSPQFWSSNLQKVGI